MSLNFGELEFYSGGFNLPEGNYCVFFDVRMHAGTKQDGTPAGPERLGVMLHAYPIAEDGTPQGDEAMEKFLSMGGKANQTYAPDPNTADANGWCKGLALVPGGPGAQPNNSTNWAMFLKSLYDCALPKGVFTNDLSVIDGIWIHTANVPEPEERKGFGQSTGEVEQQQRKGPSLIPVVTAILDGGKPWEGTGGLIEAKAPAKKAAPAAKAPAPKAGLKATPKAPARPAPAPAAAAAVDEDATKTAAVNAIGEVLGDAPNGIAKLVLRTKVFTKVKEAEGEEMAQAVASSIFADDATLNGVLAEVGYSVQGAQIKPLA